MIMNKEVIKEVIRWFITILSAVLAGLGTQSCISILSTL